MPARAIASGTISFGLVSIPVKLYTAAASEQIHFNMLHKKCGSRIKQQLFCPVDDTTVERNDIVKGYEYSRGQFVQFTDEELKALEAEKSNSIEIVEFVPLSSVDFVQIERTYYLGPDKGGDKAYKLLSQAMEKTEKVAVGRWAARGKEQLVLIRPYDQIGLIFHQLYYATEVRAFDEIDTGATFKFSATEQNLAEKLIDQLSSDEFEADKYEDTYRDRVQAAVDQKVAGQEITVAPEEPRAQIIDLFEALKKSISAAGEKSPPKPPKKAGAAPAKRARAAKKSAG
jgi:DNA end-binding protein Ku